MEERLDIVDTGRRGEVNEIAVEICISPVTRAGVRGPDRTWFRTGSDGLQDQGEKGFLLKTRVTGGEVDDA